MLDQAISSTLQQAGQLGVSNAQQTSLFHHSKTFDNQIVTYPVSKTNQVVFFQAPYSQYLEFGNNQFGNRIYPKNKKALRFMIGGQEVFAKSVASHGPLPFMAQAQEQVEKELPRIWYQQLAFNFKE